jgi:hypothetical protein
MKYEPWPAPKWVLSYEQLIELQEQLTKDSREIHQQFAELKAQETELKAAAYDKPQRTAYEFSLKGMEKAKTHLTRWSVENVAWQAAVDYVMGRTHHRMAVNQDCTLRGEE